MSSPNKEIHPSDSTPQKNAEVEMRILLQKKLGCDLKPETIRNKAGESLEIDGYSESALILCEIYAHIGALKGSQPRKPLADSVKMVIAEKWLGKKYRKIFVFADAEAAKGFQSGSWQTEAMKFLEVETMVVSLASDTRELVVKTQRKQNMGNQPK